MLAKNDNVNLYPATWRNTTLTDFPMKAVHHMAARNGSPLRFLFVTRGLCWNSSRATLEALELERLIFKLHSRRAAKQAQLPWSIYGILWKHHYSHYSAVYFATTRTVLGFCSEGNNTKSASCDHVSSNSEYQLSVYTTACHHTLSAVCDPIYPYISYIPI